MKKKLPSVILLIGFLVGMSLLLYPTISNYWNSIHQTRAIAEYIDNLNSLNEEEYERVWEEAQEYNANMASRKNGFIPTREEKLKYNDVLNFDGSGIMGYIEIESIDVTLPIYHGDSDTVLSVAAGHLDWSSLPVGGPGTHCVLSGHRGLPSAKLFTNLDMLTVGDTFVIRVLNQTLTYEIDSIITTEPDEVSTLRPVPGEDYCTLVTCTPYGVNSHRLLVRGHRAENAEETHSVHVTATAVQVKPVIVAAIVAVPLLILLFLWLSLTDKKQRKRDKAENNTSEGGKCDI